MATTTTTTTTTIPLPLLLFLLIFSLLTRTTPTYVNANPTPYLSSTTFFPNYQKMLTNFKIYTYPSPKPNVYSTLSFSIFYSRLLSSKFVTQNPDEAHLFFIPFPSDVSTRSLSRFIRDLRLQYPYWNRALGADHFFLSLSGIDYSSDRNLVELKKNSVQVSPFPAPSGNFIPHKDVTLPPVGLPAAPPSSPVNGTTPFLGYIKKPTESTWRSKSKSRLVDELSDDDEFVVRSEPWDYVGKSKFCLFEYDGDLDWMPEAMAAGCVPAVIVDRPIQDLPLIDVLRWSEMAVFVGSSSGVKGLKGVLRGISESRYERMRELGVKTSHHLMWNAEPQPYDGFHMVIYQLWLRRHTIRYARRQWAES